MADVTEILNAIDAGDPRAADQLLPLVYDELRKLAAVKLAQERPGQTLDATGLVHEAYLRLVADGGAQPRQSLEFANRRHFFAAAAEAMRRILVENARRKKSQKRGGGLARQKFDPAQLAAPEMSEDLLAVDDALAKLATTEPQVAALVKLRYFTGLTIPQATEVLGTSPRTADAWWAYARAWLLAELTGEDVDQDGTEKN
jgi:RNA polymerase sigma factor (TIGR02999 family)